jgi:hypothetical protein
VFRENRFHYAGTLQGMRSLSGIQTTHTHFDIEEEGNMILRCSGIQSLIFNNVTIQQTKPEQSPPLRNQNIPRPILTVVEPAEDVINSTTVPNPSHVHLQLLYYSFQKNFVTFPPNRVAIIFTQTSRVKPK